MIDSEIIGAILGPIITALIAGLAYAFQQWRSVRRWEGEREKALQQATEEVKFIDTWLSALGRLSEVDPDYEAKARRALADLERSYHAMAADLADDGPRPVRKSVGQHIGAIFLVPLHRTGAKVIRVFYWVLLLLATVWTIAVMATVGEQAQRDGWALSISIAFLVTLIGLLPALGLYLWARHADKEKVRPEPVTAYVPGQQSYFPAPFTVDPRFRPPPG